MSGCATPRYQLWCRSVAPTILVVEDDGDAREMVQTYLHFAGFHSVTAPNGRAGLEALEAHRPSVILLDLNMPVMDGWQFRAVQQQLPDSRLAHTPVVLLTAVSDCAEHGRRLGAIDVISKPIDLDHMIEVVHEQCRKEGDEPARPGFARV